MPKLTGYALLTLMIVFFVVGSAFAQEAEGDDDGSLFKYIAEIEIWVAQPTGLDYSPATVFDATNPFFEVYQRPTHGTSESFRYAGGLEFRRDAGALMLSYLEHRDEDVLLGESSPGNYIFTTSMASPLLAGLNDDGLADGYDSQFDTTLRDLRINYKRAAFETNRVNGSWWVGVRRVAHRRIANASYYAIVDGLPPLIPPLVTFPRPDLDPRPDVVDTASRYSGRGLEMGMEFETAMLKSKKLKLRASVGMAFLRGKVRSEYTSISHAFTFQDPLTGVTTVMEPPYDLFGEIIQVSAGGALGPAVDFIDQITVVDSFLDEKRSLSGSVIDTEVSLNYQIHKTVEFYGGFRGSSYSNVGIESRREVAQIGNQLLSSIASEEQSAEYEGFFGGVRFHF
ncbi:MAG: hypothetical protein OEV00_00975 [Acidobacteriota bacterium]|nr:hypothetical protein [Acidobacteriota bacterium]MDH3783877.1 hypothetical protein [Acidobacteriota bacterium]